MPLMLSIPIGLHLECPTFLQFRFGIHHFKPNPAHRRAVKHLSILGRMADRMNRKEFIEQLKEALRNDQLVTPKHDPTNLGRITYSSYRSVLSYELAGKLEGFIASENFDVVEYRNLNPKHHREELLEIIPKESLFSVPASGVGPDSLTATEALDRLVAVWNSVGTLHIFGESAQVIEAKCKSGQMVKKGKLV